MLYTRILVRFLSRIVFIGAVLPGLILLASSALDLTGTGGMWRWRKAPG
jgi:hypothetical protein